jgi:hypothetical protein
MYLSDGGKIPAQPLRSRLTDMRLSADSPYRRNAVSCQVSRKHDSGALAERIGRGASVMHARRSRWHLLAADDHHQRLIRPDQRDRRPRADSGTDQTVTLAVGDVGG